jgi:hypothetical protein
LRQLSLHFPENGWETIRKDWSAWWAGELERVLVVIECVEPEDERTPHYASTFLGNYGPEITADEILDQFTPRLEATYYLGDAFPRFWPNFGPGIVAAFTGAGVQALQNTTWFSPIGNVPISDLHVRQLEDKPWWSRVISVTRAAVERWGQQLSVGLTDLGGNLDILAHLRGTQQLLLDLVDHPQEVQRLATETHEVWMQSYEGLYSQTSQSQGNSCWGPCWSPARGYLLQSDFAYMISPQMYERFVLPDIHACCEALDYPFYHLDGKGQLPHLDMLLSLKHLLGIQWVPGDGQLQAEHWLPLIQRVLKSGKLCQVYVSAQGALSILHELSGKGLLLAINEALTPVQGQALLEEIRQLDGLA